MQGMQETRVEPLDGEDALEKEMVTCTSILAWKILWTKEPGRLQSMGLQRVRHNRATEREHAYTHTHTHTHTHTQRPSIPQMTPSPLVLALGG